MTGEQKIICKVLGITLNYRASQLIFDVIKDMILNGGPTDTVIVHTDKKKKEESRSGGRGRRCIDKYRSGRQSL